MEEQKRLEETLGQIHQVVVAPHVGELVREQPTDLVGIQAGGERRGHEHDRPDAVVAGNRSHGCESIERAPQPLQAAGKHLGFAAESDAEVSRALEEVPRNDGGVKIHQRGLDERARVIAVT